VREVRDEPVRSGSADLAREREGERLLAALPAAAQVVACELTGRTMSSEAFAHWMQAQRERALDVGIAIGGAFGLADVVRRRATVSLALAPWTLPHELARLVLAEQMYRAGTIIRGEPYHK
jgi:23S rRNA (pseudouridine1915-N3)-methyltransferase